MSIEDLTGTVVRKICMACSREFAGQGGRCPHDGNMLVSLPSDPYVGKKVADKYHVVSVLGTGGMGVVYLARHETMQDNVALKMLKAQFVGDSSSVKRFNHEAIAARRLRHPNVITTYDHGFTNQGQPYIVMECLQGNSLADEIKKHGQLSPERVLHIFMQACDALEHAHKQGVIHRDLKPGNFMLINYNDDPDFVKVVDFGVAKVMPLNNENSQSLTQAGEVCGSPVYMSPEQCQGLPLDRRADVYSMGVVLFEALTGKLPLLGRNMVETMHKHINDKPPSFKEIRPDLYIPEKLEQAVMRALEKQPEMRQQSMALLKQDLMFCMPRPGQSASLRTITSSFNIEQLKEEKKKSSIAPAIAAGVAAAAISAAIFYFLSQKLSSETGTKTAAPVTSPAAMAPVSAPPTASLSPDASSQSKLPPPEQSKEATVNEKTPAETKPATRPAQEAPFRTAPTSDTKRRYRKPSVQTGGTVKSRPASSGAAPVKAAARDPFAELATHLSFKKKKEE